MANAIINNVFTYINVYNAHTVKNKIVYLR